MALIVMADRFMPLFCQESHGAEESLQTGLVGQRQILLSGAADSAQRARPLSRWPADRYGLFKRRGLYGDDGKGVYGCQAKSAVL